MRDHFPKNLNNEKCSSCSSQIEAMPNFGLLWAFPQLDLPLDLLTNGKKDERQYTAEVAREHLVPSKPKDAFLRAMSGDVHHGIPNDRLSALVEAVRLDGDAKRTYIQQATTAAHLAKAACELHRKSARHTHLLERRMSDRFGRTTEGRWIVLVAQTSTMN
ncbi:hypothetical protein IAS59_000042 [Cryptococcus gattii]